MLYRAVQIESRYLLDHWSPWLYCNWQKVEVLLKRQLPPHDSSPSQWSRSPTLSESVGFVELHWASNRFWSHKEPLRKLSALLDHWIECSRPLLTVRNSKTVIEKVWIPPRENFVSNWISLCFWNLLRPKQLNCGITGWDGESLDSVRMIGDLELTSFALIGLETTGKREPPK